MDKKIGSTSTANLDDNRKYRRVELPAPKPDPGVWAQNLKNALDSDPRKKENYELYLNSQKSHKVDYLPVRMDIENLSRCNFHCTMCQVSGWPKYQRARDMTLEEFQSLVDQQYGLVDIKLHGMGEPLLGRDVFFDMVKYARAKNIWVRTTSNGSLFHFHDNYKKLIDSGINEVQISFDGATKKTFEEIRRGSRFELVTSNCTLINQYCNDNKYLVTRMWVLLQKHNAHEFFDFVYRAQEMGFKRLTFSLNLHAWWQDEWNTLNSAVTAEDSVTPDMAWEAIELGKKLGLEVTFWNITDKYNTSSEDELCPWPFQWSYVSSDMRVVPCCMIANPDVLELGDANDFSGVWNSDSYEEFRREHLEGRIPKICQLCYDIRSEPIKVISNG